MRKLYKVFLILQMGLLAFVGSARAQEADKNEDADEAPKVEKQEKKTPKKKKKTKVKKEEEPTEKTIKTEETININTNLQPKFETQRLSFCEKTEEKCRKACNDWIAKQKSQLGENFRTDNSCAELKDLYGAEDKETGCMNIKCVGEISFIVK